MVLYNIQHSLRYCDFDGVLRDNNYICMRACAPTKYIISLSTYVTQSQSHTSCQARIIPHLEAVHEYYVVILCIPRLVFQAPSAARAPLPADSLRTPFVIAVDLPWVTFSVCGMGPVPRGSGLSCNGWLGGVVEVVLQCNTIGTCCHTVVP